MRFLNLALKRRRVRRREVLQAGTRPEIPEDVGDAARVLVERCWAAAPADRPSFGEVLAYLDQNAPTDSDSGRSVGARDRNDS